MRITEVDKPVTQQQLDSLEQVLDRVFAQLGIDVEFTRHFLDRVNDERNIKQITLSELGQLFKKEFMRWGKPIARLGPDAEAVMKDLATDINIPFALNWNKATGMLELVAKTVMRKKNFRTPNQEFPVETYTLTASQQKKINESFIAEVGPAAAAIPVGIGAMELLALGLGFASIAAMQQAYKQNPNSIPDMFHGAVDLYNRTEDWITGNNVTPTTSATLPGTQLTPAEIQSRISSTVLPRLSSGSAEGIEIQKIQDYLDSVATSSDINPAQASALSVAQEVPSLSVPELGPSASAAVNSIAMEPVGDRTPAPDLPAMPDLEPAPDLRGATRPAPPPVRPVDTLPPSTVPGVVAEPTSAELAAAIAAANAGATALTRSRTADKNQPRRYRDRSQDDSPYDDPLRRWVKTNTPATFESAGMISEGGSMPGVGAIHIDEIKPTLEQLQKTLGIDLINNTLGSVGKRQFSGDIDVALQIDPADIPAFIDGLKKNPLIQDIAKSSVIMTKVKIVDFDESKSDGRPRTGYVQVDFMPGDPGWLKTYYHSPSETESKYKGVYRNIMISTIAAVYDRQDSEQKLDDGRSLESVRYMWSPTDGLIKVRRTPVPNKKGDGYTKKNNNEIIEGPWKQPAEIASQLNLGDPAVLNSFETLLAAVKKNYSREQVQAIIKSFADNSVVKDVGVPEELTNK